MSTTLAADTRLPDAAAPAPAPGGGAPRHRPAFQLGKYREIIIAVAFFLLFDLGVLVLNFYTSFQIGQDAVGINLAGRQRMLSQRMTKALLSYEAGYLQGQAADADREELAKAVALFDTTLGGFRDGARVPGGDGQPVWLNRAEGEQATEILNKAGALWQPYKALVGKLLAPEGQASDVQAAVSYAKTHNLKLLGLMNELTTALEANASQRASTLRLVQTAGIVLALVNFIFILFKFIRRLQRSDAATDAANQETREILGSVREGLFLITPELRLGTQLSDSLRELFGRPVSPGDDFSVVLAQLVQPKDLEDACGYMELLFQPHVKESLVQSINPLAQVAVTLSNRLGAPVRRTLSFQFNRAVVDGAVRHLLVTVQDVTALIELQGRLETDRARSQREFSLMLAAMAADPVSLRQFVERTEAGLLEVNDLLRSAGGGGESTFKRALDGVARRIHAFKGEAAMMALESLAEQLHQFENGLQTLREASTPSAQGEALLALPSGLEQLLGTVGALRQVCRQQGEAEATETATESVNSQMERLIQQMAHDQGKRVFARVRLGGLLDLEPADQALLRDVTVQLVRNAVSHGLETPEARGQAGKAAEGRLDVGLQSHDEGWTLTVRDDGQGLSADRVRARLLALGWYQQEQLESFSERQIVEQIFKPGFSTADRVSAHAGRGAGLDVVMASVQRLGARIRLTSTPGQFTEFKVRMVG
ncbi:ATP-binding protein [Ideonella livida]|uniref:histidine kinase n=1 Tax=Ideonella livida TaxID=2707176 RepID=A0A7C9PIC5_9BURK|nr:type IV pili methyl-accepting chemotaxis transducer N-terminal domain-containing protein [Ideonella livida]NDY92737.1 chemotaxis protein CheA [Ideonella livida]